MRISKPLTIPPQGPSGAPVNRLRLRFIDLQGRVLFPELPVQQFPNGFLAWSPDGRRLAAASRPANGAATIWIVEPRGRLPIRKLLDLPTTVNPVGMTWVPDGSGLVIATQTPASDVVLFDVGREE